MTDKDIIEHSLVLMRGCTRAVRRALPNTDPELIGGFFANLLDLWETGRQLDRELQRLVKFRFPRDKDKLYDVLIWIDATQVDMGSYWIDEVKKDGAKLRRALDKLEREERKSGAPRDPKSRRRRNRSGAGKGESSKVDFELRPAQKTELERRLRTFDRDRSGAVTWKQLRSELKRRSRRVT